MQRASFQATVGLNFSEELEPCKLNFLFLVSLVVNFLKVNVHVLYVYLFSVHSQW